MKNNFFLLSIKITLPLTELGMVGSRLISNSLFFSGNIWVDIQLVNFLLLFNVSELSIEAKAKKF